MQTPLRPRVLIIGGGFAGLAAKHEILSQTHEAGSGPLVTLIDDKPFFEYTPALARCIPYPSHIHSITVSHKNDTDIEFIRGRVTQVTTSEATVACGGTETLTVPFDYCIWATGVSYGRPFARGTGLGGGVEVRMGEMASFRRAVAEADRYVPSNLFLPE